MMLSKSSMKSLVRAAALAIIALVPVAASASTLHPAFSLNAFLGGKEKSVHFSLRNESGASIDLLAGDKTMTLAVGQTMDLKLAVGTRIVTVAKTDKRDAGAVICVVSAATADTTIVLN